mmetsp:Transcript_58958/g.140758  ORF Transcript_58958/g.140758 Transcript_58958/m.140758 type:complete len:166 (+) Transcript_58958:110-607(+)|eukprot:CAMPEP_0178396644 /NCGR_PEP_ID=MMETSP0689_2-20121128/13834_1 /TAXON_ID=160604 /ORGANISM="Amphidinium massartii, Strain CS-259" /LENGTH=165 /DNA_ID=CAMNT_0020017323 /DNA_START=31 /DNA_END=528 /DNA_ORIENTATION=+
MPATPPLLPLKALHRRVSDAIKEHTQEVGSGVWSGASTRRAASSFSEGGFGLCRDRREQSEPPSFGSEGRGSTPPPPETARSHDGKAPGVRCRRVTFAHTPMNTFIEVTPYSQVYGMHPNAFEFDSTGMMQPVGMGTPQALCGPQSHTLAAPAQGWVLHCPPQRA